MAFDRMRYWFTLGCCLTAGASGGICEAAPALRCGAAAVDVTPRQLPVIRNGGFLEALDSRVADPLHARCVALERDGTTLAIVVVDSCMIPLDVCDRAKKLAAAATGIPIDHMLISATHTHSAPSVMDYCLGSRADAAYREFLPGRIALAIEHAQRNLQPARVGWAAVDAADYTKCRRWITRSDKPLTDPFGEPSVRAMMHPGHQNPDFVGPSGPIDPWLTVLMVQSAEGRPLAMLANFSMHYFGGTNGVSADYFGRFAARAAERLAPNDPDFVGIMSQGTSGDLWWGDYGVPGDDPRRFANVDQFTDGLVELAVGACDDIEYRTDATLAMAERRITLERRLPSDERLAWARRLNELRGDRPAKDRPEVYALQAAYLHDNPTEEVVVQAVRIGDLGITALPNEVYALTGLKLKQQSPLPLTMNISLANGASGYIPPPEQHALGGYTTWPARTAGLETSAEPRLVQLVLGLLEEVGGGPRRPYVEKPSTYSQAVLAAEPFAYWRLAEMHGPAAVDAAPGGRPLRYVGLLAYHLPGREGPTLGTIHESRAVQLAGGKLAGDDLDLGESYTVEFFFEVGTPTVFRPITAALLARGTDRLELTGSASETPGRLAVGDHVGRSDVQPRTWHHVVFVRNGDFVQVFLDGRLEPEISQKLPAGDLPTHLTLGGDVANLANLEGRLDEVAVFDRALTLDEIRAHFQAAGYDVSTDDRQSLDAAPLSPIASLRQIHVREGYRVELVAAEPLTRDPVAIDWGPDGRLWVAEMADYPLGMDGAGKPGGRIRWLADTDDDGQYDKSVVFLDNVGFPNGVMAWGAGVLVTAAPEIFYAEDVDGDGVADLKETLYSGFLEGNQQLRVNGLRWGLDNWVYCASGAHYAGFGAETSIFSTRQNARIPLGSRDFRIRPDSGQLDPQSGPSQFGRVRDDWGNWFGVQNSQPLWHYVVADQYLRRNQHAPSIDPRQQVRMPRMPRVFSAKPPQKRFHGFDHAGHNTSACGISVYRDELLFGREATQAFTCEPFHNLVQRHVLTDEGVSFRGERGDDGPIDFFASADRWCRPVMTRTGPDGALWIVDMYRYMIEHPEWLPQKGQDELREDFRAGDEFGRIYRIYPAGTRSRPVPRLDGRSADELVELLADRNGLIRDLAHRLLLVKADAAEVPRLEHLAQTHSEPKTRVQALCVLDGLDRLGADVLQRACQDSSAAVRRHAVRLAETRAAADAALRSAVLALADDEDAKVRLQVACTLGEWNDAAAGQRLADMALRSDNDRYMTAAIISSAETHYAALVDRVAAAPDPAPAPMWDALLAMGPQHPQALARLLRQGLAAPDEELSVERIRRLTRWLDLLADRGLSAAAVLSRGDENLQAATVDIQRLVGAARRIAFDPREPLDLRAAAIDLLGRESDATGPDDISGLADLLTPQVASALQLAAVRSLSRVHDAAAADALLAAMPTLLPDVRAAAIDAFLRRGPWTVRLMAALEDGRVSVLDVDLAQRQRLLESPAESIASAARDVFEAAGKPSREIVLSQYARVAELPGDPAAGRQVFEQNCQTCHSLDVNQQPTGPDLRTLTNRSPQALLSSILDPSQAVEPRYLNYNVVLHSGETLTGVVVGDSAGAVELALADGQRRAVLRDAIDVVQRSQLSLMPEGFENKISVAQMADLIAYLGDLGR